MECSETGASIYWSIDQSQKREIKNAPQALPLSFSLLIAQILSSNEWSIEALAAVFMSSVHSVQGTRLACDCHSICPQQTEEESEKEKDEENSNSKCM